MGTLQGAEQCVLEQGRQRDSSHCAMPFLLDFSRTDSMRDHPTPPRVGAACHSLRLCSFCWDTNTRKHLEGSGVTLLSRPVTVSRAGKSQSISQGVSGSLQQPLAPWTEPPVPRASSSLHPLSRLESFSHSSYFCCRRKVLFWDAVSSPSKSCVCWSVSRDGSRAGEGSGAPEES